MKPRVLLTAEAGQGEPLVLVPGGLTGWLSWTPHQELLRDRYRVIRVQPIHNEMGSAGHRGDPSYTWEVAVESLRMTVDHLELEQSHLAGWSAGGKGLLDFALAYPDRLSSMTLVEPAAEWVIEAAGEPNQARREDTGFLEAVAGRDVTDDDLARFLHIAGFVASPAEARTDPFWEGAWPHRMTLSWLSESVMGSDHSLADLERVTCPVLLTKGTRTGSTERRIVDLLGARFRRARVVEFAGTHAHHIESIEPFCAELVSHLRASGDA